MHKSDNSHLKQNLDYIITHLDELCKEPAGKILENAIQLIMESERKIHLEKNSSGSDKANGYYQRSLGTPLGKLSLNVPRDRDGDFRPEVLPRAYSRDLEERLNVLQALFTSSYSPTAVNSIFHSLGLHYSHDQMEKLKKEYLREFEAWSGKEIPHDCIAIFIDAYHTEMIIDSRVKKIACYLVIGIDFNGFKDLFGIYVHSGNESKEYWLSVLNSIIERGLKRPLFVVSDDFSGLREAVSTLFPSAYHQLCYIHMQRNVRRNMATHDAKNFNQTLIQLKLKPNADDALLEFQNLISTYKDKYPSFIQSLKMKAENYFAFLNLSDDVRKFFYTTNCVESFNSILEKSRIAHGGFFQSEQSLKINIYIKHHRLKYKKWWKAMPLVVKNLYQFRQLFGQKYSNQPKVA